MKNKKKNLLYWVIAVAVVACVLFGGLQLSDEKKVDIVFLGDSIIGNVSYEIQGIDVVQEKTGMKVFNGAFGGACMSYREWENVELEPLLWCMAELSEAICYEDFKAQKAGMAHGSYYGLINHITPDYYANRMDELSNIDFSKVKILVIQHGTNDYNTGTPLDNENDPYDKTTFGGALRSSLKLFQEKYPSLRIIIMTPTYCELGEGRTAKCYNTNYGGGTLDQFVEKEKEIAKQFGVEVLDAYHNSGIWEDNADIYLDDGIHPSQEGQILLGEFISEYLLQEPYYK